MKRIAYGLILFVFGITSTSSLSYSQVKIMPLGDSITRGVSGSDPVGGYRDDLYDLLTNAGVNFDFVGSSQDGAFGDPDHEGHDGWRADQINSNVNSYLNASQPDIVLLHIGTNDIGENQSNSSTISEITNIVNKIHNYNADTKILLCSLVPRDDEYDVQTSNLNALIEQLYYEKKADGYNIYYVGQNEVFKSNTNWAVDYITPLPDGVHPNNTGYNLMAKVFFNAIMNVLNTTPPYVSENFDRSNLGSTWTADNMIAIVNNQLSNTSTVAQWDQMAIYLGQMNPTKVSLKWGNNADSLGIAEAGFALMLNSASTNTNGYLAWIGHGNEIALWTIKNGVPESSIDAQNSLLDFPQPGDIVSVEIKTDADGHHFTFYVNDALAGTVSDPLKKRNPEKYYVGIISKGNLNNDLDDFDIYKLPDTTPPAQVTDLQIASSAATSINLTWTAPGDDDNEGQASSYDIRYSTSPINTDTDFDNALQAANVPTPSDPGTQENFAVSNLNSNTTYYFALKTGDEVPNYSIMSNTVQSTTLDAYEYVDTFDRTNLGNEWVADPEFVIDNNELSNTSTEERWDFLAINTARKNPSEVSFKYGQNATANDIENTALAIMLDSWSLDTTGYLVWYRPSINKVYGYTLVNGAPDQKIGEASTSLPDPQAGSTFKVTISSDENGHHFDCYIDNQFYGRIDVANPQYGLSDNLYAGVMLYGNRNNNIDDFTIITPIGQASELQMVYGNNQVGNLNQKLPDSLVVKVVDANYNPVSGAQVNFEVTSGQGTVSAPVDNNVRVEAESGVITAPMEIDNHAEASGGQFIQVPGDQTFAGSAEYTVQITTSGNYRIWGRVMGGSYQYGNSLLVTVDNGAESTWRYGDISKTEWSWQIINNDNVPQVYTLTAGSHTIKIDGRQPTSKLDKLLITNDPNYVPAGKEAEPMPISNQNGLAYAFLTLGTTAGPVEVTASSPNIDNPVVFSATALPDPAAQIAKTSGDSLEDTAGATLVQPFVVTVMDQYGNPIQGTPVEFVVTAGEGSLSTSGAILTDENGQAQSTLTLGTVQRVNLVEARADGLTGSPVVFHAFGTGFPADIQIVSGDIQEDAAGAILPQPFVVKVLDEQANPSVGKTVTWNVVKGNGVIQGNSETVTDQNGETQIMFQLATNNDTNQVSATVNGLTPALFTAYATSGIPKTLQLVSQNNVSHTVGQPLPNPVQVKAVDAQDVGMPNVKVLFAITGGGGSIDQTDTVTTNANGIAQTNWTLGQTVGQNTLQVKAFNYIGSQLTNSPLEVKATGTNDVAANLQKVSGDSATYTVNDTLPNPFIIKVNDQYGNPVPKQTVTYSVTGGNGHFLNGQSTMNVTTDGSGQATTFLVLGIVAGQYNNEVKAEVPGLSGKLVNFVASATADVAAKILKVSGDQQLGFVREPLTDSLKVKVTDEFGNSVQNHKVDFTVEANDGTINGDTADSVSVNTNSNGFAAVKFTPGAVAGELINVVHAKSYQNGDLIPDSPIEFKSSARYRGTTIEMVDGDHQSGVVTSNLPVPLQVKITDDGGSPIANQPVTFSVISGGGSFNGTAESEVQRLTDSQGIASVTFKLGPTAGEDNNIVHATATDGLGTTLTNSPIEFVASATSSDAVEIRVVESTNNQTGVAGDTLDNALQVSVLDNLGNGVPGHPVTFQVTEGGGYFAGSDTDTTVNSNANGIAEVKWIIGTVAGSNNNHVKVESTNGIEPLQNSPLTYTASAIAGMTDSDSSTITASSPHVADGISVSDIVVTLYDRYGNPVPNKQVEVSVSGDLNTINPNSVTTNNQGKANFTLATIVAEEKVITATNTTNNIQLNSTATVEFISGPADHLSRYSGHNQTRNVGTILAEPLVVQVEDRYGNPVAGTTVYFEVKNGGSGGGYMVDNNVVSDTAGLAKAFYVLGDNAGTNLIEAKSGTLTSVLFSVTGVENSATRLKNISGGDQNGIAGQPLANPLVVQAVDQNDDPVKNVEVTFSIATPNGGQVSQPQPVHTDAYGKASTVFTLGQTIGVHIAKAESQGLQDSPILFIANASSSPAHALVKDVGDGQTGTVKSVGSPLQVKVVDEFGNPVVGYPVMFEVMSGDVTITNSQPDTSGTGGYTKATFQFGSQAGESIIHATANNLDNSPVEFRVTARADVATTISLLDGNNQRGTVGHELMKPLQVIIRDQWGNPVSGFPVTFFKTSGVEASIVGDANTHSNIDGIASCEIMLGQNPGNFTVLAIVSGLNVNSIEFDETAVVNEFPILTTPFAQVSIEETKTLSFQVSANDSDNDPLQFIVYGKPDGASVDSINTTTRKFNWTPDYTQQGSYSISFEVLDGNGGFDRDTIDVTVMNKNRLPEVVNYYPPNDSTINPGKGIQFSIQATDPDQETIIYFWEKNAEKVAEGATYNYSSSPSYSGTDIIIGFATDGIDTVSHKWEIIVTGIELESFTATALTGRAGIELNWVTTSEKDNQGFNLYRGLHQNSQFTRINDDLISTNGTGNYRYVDSQVEAGVRYYYKLEDISIYGQRTMHGPVMVEVSLPTDFDLKQNYPNPFNPETTIKFQVPKQVHVYLAIYNILGQEVRTLINENVEAGYRTLIWDGRNENGMKVNSGIYYLRIKAGEFVSLKKMVLLR